MYSIYILYIACFSLQSREQISSRPNSRFKGYIAKWYTYFNSDSYFPKLSINKNTITNNLLGLWITFAILNVFIPVISITRGKVIIFKSLEKVNALSKSRLHRATVATIILLNIIYTVLTIGLIIRGYPNVLDCYLKTAKHFCNIPQTASNYNYVLGILITKAVVLPVAFTIEFAAAMDITRETMIKDMTRPFLYNCLRQFVQVFVTWQLLVFAQITVGLISIPILVLTFISPVHVILLSGGIVLIIALLVYILSNIPLPMKCTPKLRFHLYLRSFFATAEILIVVFLMFSIYLTYFIILKHGMKMSGTKGFIISLIPTIPIPIIIWIVKKRFFKQNLKMKGMRNKVGKRHSEETLMNRSSSLSTEEEMIHILSTTEESDI